MSRIQLGKLIWQLGVTHKFLFMGLSRCMLHPLYSTLYSAIFHPDIPNAALNTLKWRAWAIKHIPSMAIGKGDLTTRWKSRRNFGSCFGETKYSGGFDGAFDRSIDMAASSGISDKFPDTSTTYSLELLAVGLSLFGLRFLLNDGDVVYFIDNNASLFCSHRGASSVALIDKFIDFASGNTNRI